MSHAPVCLCLLGPTILRDPAGEHIRPVLAQPKRMALLAYMAVEAYGTFQRRDKLLALFWPELDQDHARAALRQSLHFLRRCLGDDRILLTMGREEVSVSPKRLWCDVAAFRRAAADRRWDEATGLYRGEFLDGLFLRDCQAFESWLEEERRILGMEARDLAWLQAFDLLKGRELGKAKRVGAWALGLKVPDEHTFRSFLQDLLAAGDQPGALYFFEAYQRKLWDDLALTPSSLLLETAREIRDVELVSAPHPSPYALEYPQPPTVLERQPTGSSLPTKTSDGSTENAHLSGSRVRRGLSEPAQPPKGRIPSAGRRVRPLTILSFAALILVLVAVVLWAETRVRVDPIRSIIVMPPEATGHPEEDAFLLDLHRNLISAINRQTEYFSPSQASALTFRHGDLTLAEFAGALGVDGALEWVASRSSDSVWLEATLYTVTPPEQPIWHGALGAELQAQRTLSLQVASRLFVETRNLRRAEGTSSPSAETLVDPEALAAYQMGMVSFGQLEGAALRRALAHFSESIRKDPDFAPAYAWLSLTFSRQAMNGFRTASGVADSARILAVQALALDSELAEAHLALGCVHFRFDWDLQAAEEEFRRALALDASLVETHIWYAHLLGFTGRESQALTIAREAVRADPLGLAARAILSFGLAMAGREAEALEVEQQILGMWPDWPFSRLHLAHTYLHLGRWEDAAREYADLYDQTQNLPQDLQTPGVLGWEGLILGQTGYGDRAEQILDQLLEMKASGEIVSSEVLAWAYLGLGRLEESLAWLEQAFAEGDAGLVFLNSSSFRALRGNPRFEAIRRGVFGDFVVDLPTRK